MKEMGNPNAKGYAGKGSRWLRCSACHRPQPTPHHGSSSQEASLAAHSPHADFRRCPGDLASAIGALEKALQRGSPPLVAVHAARALAVDAASAEKSYHVHRLHRAASERVRGRAGCTALRPSAPNCRGAHGKDPLSRSSPAAAPSHGEKALVDTRRCGTDPLVEESVSGGAAVHLAGTVGCHLLPVEVQHSVQAEVPAIRYNDRVLRLRGETATGAVEEEEEAAAVVTVCRQR